MLRTPHQQVDSLLNALDPLPYPQRMRELALQAREFTPLRPVLAELEERGSYGRDLAVVAAAVGRDAAWIADRIADPDSFVRGHALQVADSLQVPDSAYESGLVDASEAVRRDLLRAIVSGRRTALADRLLDGLRQDWGDTEAARLLPGCTPETVTRLLPELFHAFDGWRALARRHPEVLLDVAERELAELPTALYDTWWERCADAMAAVVPHDPLRVLGFLEQRPPRGLPDQLRCRMGVFAAAAPERVLCLLATPGWAALGVRSLNASVLRRLARIGSPELISYGRVLAASGELPELLNAMPPGKRHAFLVAVREGRGAASLVADQTILSALPRTHAPDEARRTAAAARERGADWHRVLLVESFLPVDEVRATIVDATRRPAAEDRALAWPLLIRNAARSGDSAAVTAALEEMGRLRNEQDPVRSAALGALAAVRPALFTEDAEPHLDRVAGDAVAARDSSALTRQRLSALALGVLREHAAGGPRELVNWALRTLVRITGHTGTADLGRLDHTLARGQEHRVYEALRPWIEAGAEKADYSLVFALTRAVGRRAAGMAELQDLLWQAIRYGGKDSTVRTAVDLWLEPPATRDERVARILAHEPSAGALPAVWHILARRRTDLLDPFLAETPPYGRFLPKREPWTAWGHYDVRRWLPRQQRAFIRQLTGVAADSALPHHRRVGAIEQAARVPEFGSTLVRQWTGSGDVVLAEAALAALARTDRPQDALPELLAHAGDDRARVAVYAATGASRHARPSLLAGQLGEMLRAPDTKVTSRKEAVRLAATRLPAPSAATLLNETYGRPGAHRDVRTACVAFAGGLVAHEPVWEVLRDAAGAEPVLRRAVLRVRPLDLPEPHRERYARLVHDVCATDDPETATLALGALPQWTPWSPDAPAVLVRVTTDLDDRTNWHVAAKGLVTVAEGSPQGARWLLEALRILVEPPAADADADLDAGQGRDRPARRRVEYIVSYLIQHGRPVAEAARPAALAASDLLAGYDAHVPQAATLAAYYLDLDARQPRLEQLAALTAGRPALAVRTAGELGERLARRDQEGDPGALLAEVRRLTAHGGHAEGLLAVAVTGALGGRTDWAAPWREELTALRRHPVADVRDAALDEVTAYE
ncbi:hypothetical protein [Streptomyces sp. SID12501]|uniref:HEAT repeat domain-containing protein n=1 Tax=Streptomyces sp. SID12501 TaxID=2706042 RepID=A0A6B3BN11_9ACTN|nr:hypothetical protein [Streptomyces sp. SID12501]NEC85896.1 hypothetical protein [Streptomyces sp. SID12501]